MTGRLDDLEYCLECGFPDDKCRCGDVEVSAWLRELRSIDLTPLLAVVAGAAAMLAVFCATRF